MQVKSIVGKYGTPEITRFFGGASGAFSLQLDDSMPSQVENALPLLSDRKIRVTFFVNPGIAHYAANRRVWEEKIRRDGHELGNHTFTHKGATSAAEAQNEIARCAAVIAAAYDNRPRLTPFMIPGGVPWKVTPDELTRILDEFKTFLAPRSGILSDEIGGDTPTALPEKALRERSWQQLGMHGVGGEWLSTSIPRFTRLVDFLTANSAALWVAPTSAVYQYEAQRDAARPVVLTDASERGFSVTVTCDESHIKTFGVPFAALYNQPLTVRVPVPNEWRAFTVRQKTRTAKGEILSSEGKTIAQFAVLPNRGIVQVTRG